MGVVLKKHIISDKIILIILISFLNNLFVTNPFLEKRLISFFLFSLFFYLCNVLS